MKSASPTGSKIEGKRVGHPALFLFRSVRGQSAVFRHPANADAPFQA